jgi:hypothetical protein
MLFDKWIEMYYKQRQEIADIMCQDHGMAWQSRIMLRLTAVSAEGTTLFWAQQCNGGNWSLYSYIQLLADILTLSL